MSYFNAIAVGMDVISLRLIRGVIQEYVQMDKKFALSSGDSLSSVESLTLT